MDIKLKNCNTDKDYKYVWFGILTLALSGISASSAELSLSDSAPGFLVWLAVYACGAAAVLAVIELVRRLGADREDMFIDYFDNWKLETPIILLLVFYLFYKAFIFHGWFWNIVDNAGSLGMSFTFLLTSLNLFLLSIPFMLVISGLILVFIRHIKILELRNNNRYKTLLPKLKERYRQNRSLYEQNYDFQKKQFRHTVTGVISIIILMITMFIFLGASDFIMYTGGLGVAFIFVLYICGFVGIFQYIGGQKTVGRMGKVLDAVELIESGGAYHPDGTLKKNPAFEKASVQLVSIQKQMQNSATEQKKSERMKVDLITNVSHDLKTPLTSIISYIDLLQKEEGLSEEANDYLKILAQKSDRLKDMVQDLFEISKATSGTIELELECLNMRKLLEQTLGDMDDQIQKSGLVIKKNFCKEDAYFLGDGKRMYRVYQNLIENALKYSLTGTRIYIDLTVENTRVTTVIKNIAGYEMNFTDGDITERFVRGDKERSSEGNGLGLSIAKSFTEMCYGNLDIDVDGDLFKVTVSFPETNKELGEH